MRVVDGGETNLQGQHQNATAPLGQASKFHG